MSLDARVERLEQSGSKGRIRNVVLQVCYYETITTDEGRKERLVPAVYDEIPEVRWDEIVPNANGDRIQVQYPKRSENPATEATENV
jgi:hypothetical protein